MVVRETVIYLPHEMLVMESNAITDFFEQVVADAAERVTLHANVSNSNKTGNISLFNKQYTAV